MTVCQKCKRSKPSQDFIVATKRTSRESKKCKDCRAKNANNREAYWATKQRYLNSETRKVYKETVLHSDEWRAIHAEHQRKQRKTETHSKYLQSDAYKESRKRENKKMMTTPGAKAAHYVQVALSDATSGRRDDFSTKLEKFTEFTSNKDVKKFLESQFEPGMSWENHTHQGWNIGHRIAQNHYNFELDEDVRRCWKKANLFPQWASGPGGNLTLGVKFPPEPQLLQLRACWPTAWNDTLPSSSELRAMEKKKKMKRSRVR